MSGSDVLREAIALAVGLAGLLAFGWYARVSFRLFLDAVRKEATMIEKGDLPFRAGVSIAAGVILLSLSAILWVPELLPLLVYGLIAAAVLGASAAVNIAIRQRAGRRLVNRK